MILRSITKHVTDQNWFAVFIDFFIVVFGVFIGIQVSNWNETQKEKKLTINYQSRIVANLDQRIETLEALSAYFEQTFKHANDAAISYIERSDDLNEQFLIDLYQASQRVFFVEDKGVYDELISTGRIDLIGDQFLRDQIGAYYSNFGVMMAAVDESGEYRPEVRKLIDFRIQQQIRERCGDQFENNSLTMLKIKLRKNCELDLTNELVRQQVKKLIANQALEELLTHQINLIYNRLTLLNILIEVSESLKV